VRNVGSGRSVAIVALVGIDGETVGRIRETLAAEAVLPQQSVAFGDAYSAISRTRPDVIIVGFHQGPDAPLEFAETMKGNTTLVAISDNRDADTILKAMRAGYKEFVVLPTDAQNLRQVVHDAAYATADEDEQGTVVVFWGAKGGVGTTLLASHLAAELAPIHRVLCLDLDFSMGDLASVLDLTPKDTIVDLLPRADRLDERALTGATTLHKSKMHVIAQPGEPTLGMELIADDVYNIIHAGAKAYQYVLVDCGTYLDPSVEMALNVADVVVLVCTPNVVSVRNAFRRIKTLDMLGVDKERIRLVVNRVHAKSYVSIEDIEQNLGLPVTGTIPDDSLTVDKSINEGKLLRESGKRSEVAKAISTLVGLLTEDRGEEDEDVVEEEPAKGGFFSRFFG